MMSPAAVRRLWRDRLYRARKRGRFTQRDIDLAGSFTSCAIGERSLVLGQGTLTHRYTRDEFGDTASAIWVADASDTMTNEAFTLGIKFLLAIEAQNITEAHEIYAAIQKIPTVRPLVTP